MKRMSREFFAQGHMIDSLVLSRILHTVDDSGGQYEILEFDMGKRSDQESELHIRVMADSEELLNLISNNLTALGCYQDAETPLLVKPSKKDGTVPDDFYSTTNHRTLVKNDGRWIEVQEQRMDAVIVMKDAEAFVCRKLRDVRKGDLIVCSHEHIKVKPPYEMAKTKGSFAFMASGPSSERKDIIVIQHIAEEMRSIRGGNGEIAVVAGPVVVHTGGVEPLCELIRAGFVQVLLGGNAVAVHDVEHALFGTSLGVDLNTGFPVDEGHKNHIRAINAITKAGGLEEAVRQGILQSGIMLELIRADIPFVLAGSLRDDGPLPDTITDMIEAQERYAEALVGVDLVLILGSMLHGIATGNMLPSWVRTVCVDINPAVVTKLSDRGTGQAIGVVNDVGLFLDDLRTVLMGPGSDMPLGT